jgi:3-hydroxyacyl-CoA dehydrogenase
MTTPISYSTVGVTALIRLQSAPVNALSREMRVALYASIQRAADDPSVQAIVIAGDARFFSGGADIAEFRGDELFAGLDPVEVVGLLEALDKPTVAAIDGVALGGGLELTMGCHARIASHGATFGLPEIKLGLIPGATGTQRLPRLVGREAALRMMITGETINATRARELGLVDQVVATDAVAAAMDYAAELLRSGERRRASHLTVVDPSGSTADITNWQALIHQSKAPVLAAEKILFCVQDAIDLPFDEAVKLERQRFVQCNLSDAAQGLQHAFFATRAASKLPVEYAQVRARSVDRVAIVGGGTMGRGIAMTVAQGDVDVSIIETDESRAAAAMEAIHLEYQRQVKAGRIAPERADLLTSRMRASADFDLVREADLVIEAVYEDLDIKRDIARRLGQVCKQGAIIASNTSTLDIDLLARESGRPADFLGLHFFSPANVMRLVEIVRGLDTEASVMAAAMNFARRIRKTPVITGVCYGFIGNRMLEPYLREVEALLLAGCTPAQIDAALEGFGMAMGPCRMMDLAGVDVVAKVVQERDKQGALPVDPHYRIVCRELAAAGYFGQKAGRGFYTYEGRRIVDDSNSVAAIRALASRHGITARAQVSAQEIVERCLYPLVNEGFAIVEEGIAYRESDVDVVWLTGYGFPAQRGGPLFYARRLGLDTVGQRLDHYATVLGDPNGYWQPATHIRNAMNEDKVKV